MKVNVIQQTEVPDERGPDLLKDVKQVDMLAMTPNQVRALLLLFNLVGGGPDNTLRGEISTLHYELLAGLGVPYNRKNGHSGSSLSPSHHSMARRYLYRDDLAVGAVTFLKGGAHV